MNEERQATITFRGREIGTCDLSPRSSPYVSWTRVANPDWDLLACVNAMHAYDSAADIFARMEEHPDGDVSMPPVFEVRPRVAN